MVASRLVGRHVAPGPRSHIPSKEGLGHAPLELLVDGEVGQRGTIGVGRYRFR